MASSTRQAIACIFLIFAIVIVARSQTEKRPGAIFSGKVTFKGKGAPGIAVGLVNIEESSPSAHRTLTDDQGYYRIANVGPGKYQLMVVAPGFITTDGIFSNKTYLITKSETLENVDFTLVRGGVITGKVTDSDGRPLVEEYVYLYPVEAKEGYSRRLPGAIRTDDRGVYRIFSLPPGKYKIAVGQDFGMRSRHQRTFHPGTVEISEARIIDVSEASEATNVDITLPEPAASYSAQGRVIDGDTGQPLANLTYGARKYVGELSTSELTTGALTNKDGEFKLENLPPGKYSIFVQAPPDSDWRAEYVPFEVTDRDVTGLIVKTLRGGSAAGVIVLEGTQDKTILDKLRKARVYANVVTPDSTHNATQSTTINQDGSFRIGGLQAGMVHFGVLAERFYVVRLERGGLAQPQGIELREREQVTGLRVIVNYGNGAIHGVVKVDGNPVPAKGYVSVQLKRIGDLLPGSREPARVDARGQFYAEKLLPGTYEVTVIYAANLQGSLHPATQQVVVTNGAVANVTVTVDTSANPARP